jgi:uncharacterized membrane protein YecN with MAPEG domain
VELLTLFGSIGVYRWSRIVTGRASISEWRADAPQGSEWYQRAMRAHMNCVESLPIFGALIMGLVATGLESPTINALAVTFLFARLDRPSFTLERHQRMLGQGCASPCSSFKSSV